MYQWIGFAVCIFSTLCCVLLAQIYASYTENTEIKKNEDEEEKEQKQESEETIVEVSEANERKKVKWYKLLTKPIILFMIINGLGFSSV